MRPSCVLVARARRVEIISQNHIAEQPGRLEKVLDRGREIESANFLNLQKTLMQTLFVIRMHNIAKVI
jgi:hypothetical protein